MINKEQRISLEKRETIEQAVKTIETRTTENKPTKSTETKPYPVTSRRDPRRDPRHFVPHDVSHDMHSRHG